MTKENEFKPKRQKTGGRKKGTANKTTTVLKDAIVNAFEKVGGEKYLVEVAKTDPKTFCSLLARVLPMDVNGVVKNVNLTAAEAEMINKTLEKEC